MKKLIILPLLSVFLLFGSSQIQTNAQDNVDIIMNKTYSLYWDFYFTGEWGAGGDWYGDLDDHYYFTHEIPFELYHVIESFNLDLSKSNNFNIFSASVGRIPYFDINEQFDYTDLDPYFFYYEDGELIIFIYMNDPLWIDIPPNEILPNFGTWSEGVDIKSWAYTEPDEFTEAAYNEGYSDGRASAERDYLDGYTDGYDLGKQDGIGIGYDDGYDDGLIDGMNATQQDVYNKGYQDGANESFLGNFDKWIVPAIISTLVIGGIIAFRRREYE